MHIFLLDGYQNWIDRGKQKALTCWHAYLNTSVTPVQAAEVHVFLSYLIRSRRAFDYLPDAAGGHVLSLGSGTNILGLMARQLGARRVTCIEQGPMLYRMAKQTLQSNAHVTRAKHIILVDRHLQGCGIVGMYFSQ